MQQQIFLLFLPVSKKRGRDYEQFEGNPELEKYYYKMWLAYQTWYQEYDLGPKMMLNLQKYDLSDAKNTEIVLKKIDQKLASI